MGMHAATILDCAPLSPLGGANPRLPERETLSWALTLWRCGESHAHAHGERKREKGRGFPRGDLFLRPELESGGKERGKEGGVLLFVPLSSLL